MDNSFQNKIVLITGSGRGIGRVIALHFAQRGADVIINFFRNREPAEETVGEIDCFWRTRQPGREGYGFCRC